MTDPASGTPARGPHAFRPRVAVFEDRAAAWADLADELTRWLRQGAGSGRRATLGLATGRSTEGLYAELARRHAAAPLPVNHLWGVALDEYLPMSGQDPASFAATLRRQFADPLGLGPERLLVPDGRADGPPAREAAERHERALAAGGGVDWQLLGIGHNGHLAFNEPGSPLDGVTAPVDLAPRTRQAAAARFGGLERVPRRALTMGLGTILRGRRLALLAFGEDKAPAVAAALTGPVDPACPASVLQRHPDVAVWLDRGAASRLTPQAG